MHPLDTAYFPEVFDSSMLATYKSCPQLFWKIYIKHWKSKQEKVDLHAGKAYARGIEVARRAFYEQELPHADAHALGLQALAVAYGDFECPADNPKSLERMLSALAYAFDNWPFNHQTGYPILLPGGARAIEVSFAHPLPIDHPITGQPLLYVGRGDMVCNYAGDNYIEDDKTTKQLGPTWPNQWPLRSQFMGYTWGFRNNGFRVAGCLVRGVSILKTKHDCAEAICNFSPYEIDRWYQELIEWLMDIKRCWNEKRWKYNFDSACASYGGCGFREVCKSENEAPWLRQWFEQRYWNPVTREETILNETRNVP
jgi:hypothetical protein